MLAMTYRPGEGSAQRASASLLNQVLADITRSAGGFIVPLGPLSETEVREFVDSFGAGRSSGRTWRVWAARPIVRAKEIPSS